MAAETAAATRGPDVAAGGSPRSGEVATATRRPDVVEGGPRRPLGAPRDTVQEVALVARDQREVLLRAHRRQLRWEDLEDCFSQATLELLAHARRGGSFIDRRHLANTLELRFVSRIRDALRAAGGRSPMVAALAAAVSLGAAGEEDLAILDRRPAVEQVVMLRHDLRRVGRLARQLTADQRLALASQLALDIPCAEFCRRHGWSEEKYRKVLQRARARLRLLASSEEEECPSVADRSERVAGTCR